MANDRRDHDPERDRCEAERALLISNYAALLERSTRADLAREEERKAWARLVRVLSQIATAADIVNVDDADERKSAEDDLRQLVPDVDDYLAPEPEHCGQCGAEIQGHHGYCEIVTDDDPPPSGE